MKRPMEEIRKEIEALRAEISAHSRAEEAFSASGAGNKLASEKTDADLEIEAALNDCCFNLFDAAETLAKTLFAFTDRRCEGLKVTRDRKLAPRVASLVLPEAEELLERAEALAANFDKAVEVQEDRLAAEALLNR